MAVVTVHTDCVLLNSEPHPNGDTVRVWVEDKQGVMLGPSLLLPMREEQTVTFQGGQGEVSFLMVEHHGVQYREAITPRVTVKQGETLQFLLRLEVP